MLRKTIVTVCAGTLLGISFAASAATTTLTKFEQDVSDAIDLSLKFLDDKNVFKNPSAAGNAAGLSMLALLEKRPSGNQLDPVTGYEGASADDKARLRLIAAYLLDRVNETSFYAYRDGADLMALSVYRLTGGPDKGEVDEIPNTDDYMTVQGAIDALVNRMAAAQCAGNGIWGYTGCGYDSSTTQFVVAGLAAAKGVYLDTRFANQAQLDKINDSLVRAKNSYEENAQTSPYYYCGILTSTERGHGYQSYYTNYATLQQTASGTWVQLLGGSNASTPMVKNYHEWLKNRYVWNDNDGVLGGAYWYYLWSSFKAMQLLRVQGGTTLANSLGGLDPNIAPVCSIRQVNRVPADVNPEYVGTTKGQYFDYASRIMENQCKDPNDPNEKTRLGDVSCGDEPYSYGNYGWDDRVPYAILVLQRSIGGACIDEDEDGKCDEDENQDGEITGCDVDFDGNITMADLKAMLHSAKRRTTMGAGHANEPADQAANVVSTTYGDWFQSGGDYEVNIADFTRCIFAVHGK